MTFAPRYSPDGRDDHLLDGGERQYRHLPIVGRRGGDAAAADQRARHRHRRLSYSPDGRRIVFESDRGGTQQLYVMDADGSNQRRISFGGGALCDAGVEPARRPDRLHQDAGGFRIGVMTPGGGGETHPDRRLAGRGAELGAQRPVRHVQPHAARRRAAWLYAVPIDGGAARG